MIKKRLWSNAHLPQKHKFAEVWLNHAIEELRPHFSNAGYKIPPVHVSVGFSTDGYKPNAKINTIAVCHARCLSKDNVNEIYITPLKTEPVDVLAVLAHELVHAIDDCQSGHGAGFQKISFALKLSDNPQVSLADFRETIENFRAIAITLGKYPRGTVNYHKGFKQKYVNQQSL